MGERTGTTGSAPIVWHVTEAMGGGLATAINQFVRSTPGFSHHLIGCDRPRHRTGERCDFVSTVFSPRSGPLGFIALLIRLGRLTPPDIVHVHSSWAGLFARLALFRHRAHVVYSPHSYYFDRTDIPSAARVGAWCLEWVLARLTRVVVAVSPYEAANARRLGSEARFVANEAVLPRDAARRGTPGPVPGPFRLVTVGRIEGQKDPRFFVATVQAVRAQGVDVEAVWVGSGDPELEGLLRDAGVVVTGWRERVEVLREMATASVYVHTAAWEGNPLTVLEAEALGRPLAVRSIPAMVSLGHAPENRTPADLATTVVRILQGAAVFPHGAPAIPSVALADVYREVMATGRQPEPVAAAVVHAA